VSEGSKWGANRTGKGNASTRKVERKVEIHATIERGSKEPWVPDYRQTVGAVRLKRVERKLEGKVGERATPSSRAK